MGTFEDFLNKVKLDQGLRFDQEVAEFMGIDKRSLAVAKARGSLPIKYINWYCEHYKIKRIEFENHLKGELAQPIELEDNMPIDASYIIDLQKDKIKTLEKKVDLLKANSYLLNETAFESEIPTFESWNEIKLFPFKLKNVKCTDGFMEINQHLKCPEDIFIHAFRGDGKFYSMKKAPINKLFSKRTKGLFIQKIKDLPVLVRQVKDLISKHSMDEWVTYEWEGNKVTTFVRTRIDFSASPILCHSKSTIINGDA